MKVRQRYFWFKDAHDSPLPDHEIFVDGFAGGGGASVGIARAIGRDPDVAINHDKNAIAMHMANHTRTKHYCENIWDVDPVAVCEGRPVRGAWFSPDCTHFSKSRGAKPVRKNIRGLAWVVIKWAELARPDVIFVENVEEFKTWGPVDRHTNMPVKDKAGVTFELWLWKLRELGYEVENRELVASDYGAPTTRKRLFVIARRDGQPIVWPEPTHGGPKQIAKDHKAKGFSRRRPWRTAAEIIDWSIPCTSIFLSREEGRSVGCNRPLADKTMARIAAGIRRYVIETPTPFVVEASGFVASTLMSYYGPKNGYEGRGRDLRDPLPTQPTENRFALLSAFCQRHFGRGVGHVMPAPVATQTQQNKSSLVTAFLAKLFGGVVGVDCRRPWPTITSIPTQNQIVAATLIKNNHGDKQWFDLREPLRTIVAQGTHHACVTCRIEPVRGFLFKYYGSGGQWNSLAEPCPTITVRDRLALGIVLVGGEPYQIVDIGMRMLSPRELFNAQGFPSDYAIDTSYDGRPVSKSSQVARCGNSVCPDVAEALVRANLEDAT